MQHQTATLNFRNRMNPAQLAVIGIVPFALGADGAAVPVPRSVSRFVQQSRGALYMPEAGHQLVAADRDNDGDEDKTMLQFCPLQGYDGVAIAKNGGAGDFKVETIRPCVLLAMKFTVSGPDIKEILLTSAEVSDTNLLPFRGAGPIEGFFSKDSTDSGLESPLFGQGAPFTFTLRNRSTATDAVVWGAAKVAAIVG